MHLLRTGDEAGARRALERSFKDDPYNRFTFNSLDLLDTLDTFETIRDGDIVIRFHPDEAAVMREHALPLAKEALATLSKLYDFTPTGPILVEMFPKHDDFAVRTVGLPGMVGALGACFGRVVTLDSPKARPPGEFNWGETLWHEMAHVITLQMSNNRVPRWLTEGMSVWEERRARPEWGRESDLSFARALQADKALKLDALNDGFSDPRTISLAYYQASLLVDHLVDTYGEPKLRTLLRAYGRGLETDAALQETYGVTMAGLQPGFDARLARDYGSVLAALKAPELKEEMTLADLTALAKANPGSFGVQMSLGVARQKVADNPGALEAFERAAALVPRATGENNANTYIAAIALEQGDPERAIRALDALVKADPSALDAARQLAKLTSDKGDVVRAEDAYRRAVAVDPFDTASQTGLGRLALRRKDLPVALRALRSALATNPPDRASAHADLAEAYLLNGQKVEARQQTLAALEIAPSFERAQDLLLKLIDAGGAD
jgi:tetratricopeptide (TPR) repeat protein